MMTTHSSTTGDWLKLTDAARTLGVSEITLRRKVKCGRVAHCLRDGKYFIYLERDARTGALLEPAPTPSPSPTTAATSARAVGQARESLELAENHIASLLRCVQERDQIIAALRRELEDQQTLIAFLEETVDSLSASTRSNR